ncbi:hypothetical protein TNCV_2253081 [Trichonephila clavipes]|nr:hypothetical protein TNCV_2253081 [Trichonephila clavipes]
MIYEDTSRCRHHIPNSTHLQSQCVVDMVTCLHHLNTQSVRAGHLTPEKVGVAFRICRVSVPITVTMSALLLAFTGS